MPWNNFLVVWAAALPPPTCFPHTVLWLSPRRAKPFSPFPAGYLHYPCFLLWVFNTFTSEFPTGSVLSEGQRDGIPAPGQLLLQPAVQANSNSEWEERVWTDLVQDILTPRWRESFPTCSCMLPISGKMCFTLLKAVASQNLGLVGKPPSIPSSCSGRESLECPYSRALCALQPFPAACKQNRNPLVPGNTAFFF